jgi:hypothetical protein
MMPSVMDERHEEIRSEPISSDHFSEEPVIRQLAEDIDPSGYLDECIAPDME